MRKMKPIIERTEDFELLKILTVDICSLISILVDNSETVILKFSSNKI